MELPSDRGGTWSLESHGGTWSPESGCGHSGHIVHGSADRLVRLSAAEHTARTVPGATLLVYNGAGHAPHLDTPRRFNRDLAEFVSSVR